MKKSKILHVSSGLGPGGKERQLIEIIKNINKTEFSLGIITFNAGDHYSCQAEEFSRYYKELSKRPTRLEPLYSIWKCFHDFEPDIVHTWDTLSTFYSYLPSKLFRIPIINGSIRDAGIDKGWKYYFRRFFLNRADVNIANSFAGLKAYNTKGLVIYNSIDPKRFIHYNESSEFNIVMTANFTDYKDHSTFIKASVELIKDHLVNNVYLLGEGKYMTKYQNWIYTNYPNLYKQFHFVGAVYNVEEYLANCRVGVLCSTVKYSEGLSNSVLEYMAAGLVPIVTNTGGSAEIIEDSKNGFLISTGDYKSIINLIRVLKNDMELFYQLSKEAINTINNKFLMSRNLKLIENLYKSLISKSN